MIYSLEEYQNKKSPWCDHQGLFLFAETSLLNRNDDLELIGLGISSFPAQTWHIHAIALLLSCCFCLWQPNQTL